MLKKLLPRASSEHLLRGGGSLSHNSRYHRTFSFDHFTDQDRERMVTLARLLERSAEEAVDVLSGYFDKIMNQEGRPVERVHIEKYIWSFLHKERTYEYIDEIVHFFAELRLAGYDAGELLVVLNQLHFFFTTHILSKTGIFPHKAFGLLETLQHAFNIDQQVLIEVYDEKLMQTAADGVAALMEKNSEIMYIKDLLARLEVQAELSQNVAAASEQLSASIDEVAKNAVDVATNTEDAVMETERGKEIISQALNEIIRSDQIFDQIVTSFNELQRYLNNIQEVAYLIEQIASQTNLLALNASIEAARAGEAGRGFAVVASEVRKLASDTMDSLRTVTDNVQDVSKLTKRVSDTIFSTQKVIKKGVQEAEDALPFLDKISRQINEVSVATESIASITQQQAAAVNEVTHRMIQNAELTSEAQGLSRKTGNAIYELSKITESFRSTLFTKNVRLSTRSLLQLAKTDHILWKWRVYNMLMGYENVQPQQIGSYKDCRLGRWYFDESSIDRFQAFAAYRDLDAPHQRVHQQARLAAEACHAGDFVVAEQHLREIEQASAIVIDLIDQLIKEDAGQGE